MNKKSILIVVISSILFGLVGFYGGRYYERTTVRSRFQQVRGNFQQRRQNSGQNDGQQRQSSPSQGMPPPDFRP